MSNLTVPSTLKYSLRDWVVRTGEKEQGLKTREDWTKEWRAKKVAPASMLDFEWALVPTDFQYESGDYNWGMTLFNLKPGVKFDLEVVWHQYDKVNRYIIKDMQCSPDIHPDPEEFRKQNEQ